MFPDRQVLVIASHRALTRTSENQPQYAPFPRVLDADIPRRAPTRTFLPHSHCSREAGPSANHPLISQSPHSYASQARSTCIPLLDWHSHIARRLLRHRCTTPRCPTQLDTEATYRATPSFSTPNLLLDSLATMRTWWRTSRLIEQPEGGLI